jgi:hypothetical protein
MDKKPMLPDRLCQLLTAFIDGEVSARQRKAVQCLLDQSPEARTFLQQLQDDARRLRSLPRQQLEPVFSSVVLQAIGDRRLHHGRHRTIELTRPALPAWVGLAIAASILLMIGVGSYLYFEAAQEWYNQQIAAKKESGANSALEHAQPGGSATSAATPSDQPGTPNAQPEEPSAPSVAQSAPKTPSSPDDRPDPAKQPGASSQFGVPTPKVKGLEEVAPPTVALSLAVRELDRTDHQQRLRKELQPNQSYRLELTCLDKGKALDRLQGALKGCGIRVLIDQDTAVRLKNRRLRTEYALYTEGLTVEELAKILELLGRADRQAESKKRGDGQFDQVLILSLTADDRKELSALLGVDPLQPAPAKPKTPLGVDIRQPISSGTVAQVSQSLAGQGTPRPEAGKPVPAKTGERLGVLVSYAPVRTKPAASKEIKHFLDSRKERQPGTVQLLLVLRGVNG